MKVVGIIYKSTNIINGKSYIGKTVKSLARRRTEHFCFDNPRTYFQYAIKKYGEDSFEWDILKECFSKIELSESEIFYINFFKTNDTNLGYNMTKGGDGFAYGELNIIHRPEVKAKIIAKLKSNNGSFRQEVRNKISKSLIGKKLTTDHKNAISKATKGHKGSKGEDNPKAKRFIVIFPNGDEIQIKGIREFCRSYNLNIQLMRRTLNDLTKNHKGYKLREFYE
jgi:group I intron endonuclease